MRLIDVEQCPCDKCERCDYTHPSYCYSFEEWANKTAYDVDEVVEKIGNIKECAESVRS